MDEDIENVKQIVEFYKKRENCPNAVFHEAMKKISYQLDLAIESIKVLPDEPERSDFEEHNTMNFAMTGVKKRDSF